MSLLFRIAATLAAAWAAAAATLFAGLAVFSPASLTAPGGLGFIPGGLLVALPFLPLGLLALHAAERGGMRITPAARILGAMLVCVLPLFGMLVILEQSTDLLAAEEAVAFAGAGLVVGIVAGVSYPWVRGPFRRGPRRKPREDAEPPTSAVGT